MGWSVNMAISGHVHIYLGTSVHKSAGFVSTFLGGYTKFDECELCLVLVCEEVLCVLSGNLIDSQEGMGSDCGLCILLYDLFITFLYNYM